MKTLIGRLTVPAFIFLFMAEMGLAQSVPSAAGATDSAYSVSNSDPWLIANGSSADEFDSNVDPFEQDSPSLALAVQPGVEVTNGESSLYLVQGDTAASQPSPPSPGTTLMGPEPDQWKFELTPYAWAPAVNGFIKVNDRGSDYDLSNRDVINLLDETEMMAFLNFKAKKNRTSFFVDFIYSEMDHVTSGDLGLTLPAIAQNDLDLTWKQLFLQFGAGYTLCEYTTPANRKMSFDIQGGGRYLYISGNDEIVGGPMDRIHIGLDGSENFIEPWVGAMLEAELSQCASLVVGGDVGGFGYGETVNTNWQYYAKVRYHLTPQVSLDAGWRHMKLEYEDTVHGRLLDFEQEVYGPVVGLTFSC